MKIARRNFQTIISTDVVDKFAPGLPEEDRKILMKLVLRRDWRDQFRARFLY